jgi:hypothetical protein
MTLETVPCPSCGATAAADDAFCAECGGTLQQEPAAAPAQPVHDATQTTAVPPGATQMAQPGPEVAPAAGRQVAFDVTRLDLTARIAAACGLLAFINSFLPWYTVSFDGVGVGSANAWDLDYAWIAVLLLLGLAIAIALPAFGLDLKQRISPAWVGVIGAVATIVIVIRWATYPSGSDLGVDAGAGVGTYLGLILALIVTAFGVRMDATHERALARFFDSFRHASDHQPPARP